MHPSLSATSKALLPRWFRSCRRSFRKLWWYLSILKDTYSTRHIPWYTISVYQGFMTHSVNLRGYLQ
nr:MAG TPA: hypothetical protein [Caudoviricetes sp.]